MSGTGAAWAGICLDTMCCFGGNGWLAALVVGGLILGVLAFWLIPLGGLVLGEEMFFTLFEGAEALEAAEETTFAANAARGVASEERVRASLELVKNAARVTTSGGSAIPDALTTTELIEIKDVAYVSGTRQLRIMSGWARANGVDSILVTGNRTAVTRPASKLFDMIIRRPDLGPQ